MSVTLYRKAESDLAAAGKRTDTPNRGLIMLLATMKPAKLFLTADLLAIDRRPPSTPSKAFPRLLLTERLKQFPPIDEVLVKLDRKASRKIAI